MIASTSVKRWLSLCLMIVALVALLPVATPRARAHDTEPSRRSSRHSHEESRTLQATARGRHMAQVGSLSMRGFNADVWGHEGYAYVGSWGDAEHCPAKGVRIISVASPSRPVLVGRIAAISGTSQEDVMVRSVGTAHFTGDLLVTGVQACNRESGARRGMDLWDVSNPRSPRHLAFWTSGPYGPGGARGVHELRLFQRGSRVFVAAAVWYSESVEGRGDFRLIDVTNPRQPYQVSSWGATLDGGLRPRSGEIFFGHSAHPTSDGKRVVVSYWDAGAIYLDITNPARPAYVGRTVYPTGAEGNTHSVWLAHNDTVLLTADEDFDPSDGDWGFLRCWNVSSPARPSYMGRYATPRSIDSTPPDGGRYSIHNPFVKGNRAYLSWYSDGVRVLDISSPSSPREFGSYVPPATTDPYGHFPSHPVVWGVYVTADNLILVSDINAGLYVLRYDADGPELTAPIETLAAGTTLGSASVPVRLTWSGSDMTAVARFRLQHSVNGGPYGEVALGSPTTRAATLQLRPWASHRFRLGAHDRAGNWSGWTYGRAFTVQAQQERAASISYSGRWTRQELVGASGGAVMYSRESGATATYTFTGRRVAWVSTEYVNRGRAGVWVDGQYVRTVDLYSAVRHDRRVVFTRSWASAGEHTLTVRVQGTEGRPRIDVDAFLAIR